MPPYSYLNQPAAQALYLALITEDPFYITLEQKSGPDPDTAREAMIRYMDYAIKEARDHGQLVLTPDRSSGAAIWSIPLVPERAAELSRKKKEFIAGHMGEESLATYTQIVDFMGEQTKGLVPDHAWYLSILGVTPKAQAKGLGKALVTPVLGNTDALGVPVYIESFTPANFGFYELLGFRTIKTVFEPVTQTQYAVMLRDPAPL